MSIPNYLDQKFSNQQMHAIRKSIIIPNWGKIADDREGKKFLVVGHTEQRYGTTYTYKYLFVDTPGNAYRDLQAYVSAHFSDITQKKSTSYHEPSIQSYTIRDGWMHDSVVSLLVTSAIAKLGNEKFDLLYKKAKIDEKVAKSKADSQAAKEKRLEKRAARFTNPGQKEIVRRAAMLLINDAISKAGLPFVLTDDIRGMYNKVLFHIKPTEKISQDSQFYKLFRSRDYYAKKKDPDEIFDDTGESLYESFVESGFDMDALLRLMATDKTSEHVRQFGVVFGEQLALGAIDKNPMVRKAAKIQMQKKKEAAAEAASTPLQKALKLLEEKIDEQAQ